MRFRQNYSPKCDMILVQINWSGQGGMYYFPKHAQLEILAKMGKPEYIVLPKPNTNPRGVEISSSAVRCLVNHPESLELKIGWEKKEIDFDIYDRWLELWQQE